MKAETKMNVGRLAFACALLVMVFAVVPLHAQFTYQDVYDFNCSTGGCWPVDHGQLTQGTDGNLYGTASNGGSSSAGTIFMVTPSGSYTDLVSFDGVTACLPAAGLTLASNGNFYGTTYGEQGTCNLGTVFSFNPKTSTLKILHTFNGTDGLLPFSPPVQAKDGNLYGVTGSGTTYRVALPSQTFKPLPNKAPGGSAAPLYLASDGNLYGTTTAGGAFEDGTVFRMTTAGVIKTLHSFSGSDGAYPYGPVTQGRDGNLYGTTPRGGANDDGEVFQLTLAGKLTVLHSFDSVPASGTNNDGASPQAGLLAASNGFFYGANLFGGAFGWGTLFQITKTGVFQKLFDFTGTGAVAGADPFTTLMEYTGGPFYGATIGATPEGGPANSNGNIYRLTPPNPILTLIIEGPIFVHPGVPVEILGNNLEQVTNVAFARVPAQFQPGSETYLTATVPMLAVDGFISATFPTGLQVQTQSAVHILPLITNLDPTSGHVGTHVGIVGGGFAGAKKVTFGGVKATNFTVVTPTLIQAIVPTGAITGKVRVITPNGTATSKQTFTVN
jgi:uncharacterized repeat protein (TIGR03803 family)